MGHKYVAQEQFERWGTLKDNNERREGESTIAYMIHVIE